MQCREHGRVHFSHAEASAATTQLRIPVKSDSEPRTAELREEVKVIRGNKTTIYFSSCLLGGAVAHGRGMTISLFSALAVKGDFDRGVRLAVSHSGDSDATRATTGNILRALPGMRSIRAGWMKRCNSVTSEVSG